MSRVWTLPEYMVLPEADPKTGRPRCCGGSYESVDAVRGMRAPCVYRCKSCGELFRGFAGYHFDAEWCAPFFEVTT